jgi:hypothetical protein
MLNIVVTPKCYIGELFRQFRLSADALDEMEAHPGLQVEELLDYFRDTYAGASKFHIYKKMGNLLLPSVP